MSEHALNLAVSHSMQAEMYRSLQLLQELLDAMLQASRQCGCWHLVRNLSFQIKPGSSELLPPQELW